MDNLEHIITGVLIGMGVGFTIGFKRASYWPDDARLAVWSALVIHCGSIGGIIGAVIGTALRLF